MGLAELPPLAKPLISLVGVISQHHRIIILFKASGQSTACGNCVSKYSVHSPTALAVVPFCESPRPSQSSCAGGYMCSANMFLGTEMSGFLAALLMCKRGKKQSISSLAITQLQEQ